MSHLGIEDVMELLDGQSIIGKPWLLERARKRIFGINDELDHLNNLQYSQF